MLESLGSEVRARRLVECVPFERLIGDHSVVCMSFSASMAACAALQREAEVLRREAEDVMGRKEAAVLAQRLEVRVTELQRELSVAQEAQDFLASSTHRASVEASEAIADRDEAVKVADRYCAGEAALTARVSELDRSVAVAIRECDFARRQFREADEEARLLRRQNDDLVLRLVDDKERLVTELNAMNDMITKLTKENQGLRSSQRNNGPLLPPPVVPLQKNDDSLEEKMRKSLIEDYASSDFERWAVVGSSFSELSLRSSFRAHDTEINALKFCDDDASVFTASSDGFIKRFPSFEQRRGSSRSDSTKGPSSSTLDLAPPREKLSALLSMDVASNVVATASNDRCLRAWDLRRSRVRFQVENAHGGKILAARFLSSSSTLTLASAGIDRAIKTWDIEASRSRPLSTSRTPSACHCLADAGGSAVSGHRDGCVRFWDLREENSKPLAEITGDAPVLGLATRPGLHVVVALRRDNTIHVYDDRTRGRVALLRHERFQVHPGAQAAGPTLAPDGRHVAVPSATGDALVFDSSTGLCACVLSAPALGAAPLTAVDFAPSPSRACLATVDKQGYLAFWE